MPDISAFRRNAEFLPQLLLKSRKGDIEVAGSGLEPSPSRIRSGRFC